MTITDRIPGLRAHGRHRAADKLAELDAESRRLFTRLMAAGDTIALLRQQLADTAAKQAAAEEIVVQQQADIDDLIDERDQLQADVTALKVRFGPELAAEANANAITVPPMVRDTSAIEDQATDPIDVRPLREAAAASLLGPVLDPGHIDTSQETPDA